MESIQLTQYERYHDFEGCRDVFVSNDLIYLANGEDGLEISSRGSNESDLVAHFETKLLARGQLGSLFLL